MLDIKLLRDDPDRVRRGIAAKNTDPKLVGKFLALDGEWRKLSKKIDEQRGAQKKLSEKRDIEGGKKNKEEIREAESGLADIEKERDMVWRAIPNLPSDDTPVAKDESGNKVLRTSGKPRDFKAEGFKPKSHLELGEALGLIDVESAAKISGTRFAYLKGEAALIEFGLIQHAISFLTNHEIMESIAQGIDHGLSDKPFIPVIPPVMIRPEGFERMA